MHTNLDVPNAMGLGTVLPPSGKTLENLEMIFKDTVVYATFKYRGFSKEIAIPLGNIVVLDLAPEEKKVK